MDSSENKINNMFTKLSWHGGPSCLGIEGIVEHVVVTEPLSGVHSPDPQPVLRPRVDVDVVGLGVFTDVVTTLPQDRDYGLVVSSALLLRIKWLIRLTWVTTPHLICSIEKCYRRNPDSVFLLEEIQVSLILNSVSGSNIYNSSDSLILQHKLFIW